MVSFRVAGRLIFPTSDSVPLFPDLMLSLANHLLALAPHLLHKHKSGIKL